jgi:hypothetical protein
MYRPVKMKVAEKGHNSSTIKQIVNSELQAKSFTMNSGN